MTALIVPAMDRGCEGIAPYGFPGNSSYGRAASLVSVPDGDTFTHEVGHGLGLIHAGDGHGEASGSLHPGLAFGVWPYGHGWINPGAEASHQALAMAAVPAGAGRFRVHLIDPCPQGISLDDRLDQHSCNNSDGQVHELMSYGVGVVPLPFDTRQNKWVSDITWRRFVTAVSTGVPEPAHGTVTDPRQAAATDGSLLVQVSVTENGTAVLWPAVPLDGEPLGGGDVGLSVEGRSADGSVLTASDGGTLAFEPPVELYDLEIANHADLAEIVVLDADGTELASLEASPNAPTVAIEAPQTTLHAGLGTITVELADADGDALTGHVLGSDDGGATWTILALLDPADSGPQQIDLSGFGGGDAILRVDVSDGLNTASARRAVVLDPLIRLAGHSRITTAVEISRATFPDDGTVPVAVLARADGFADALAGAPLAVVEGGPLLLTASDGLAEEVVAELGRLGVGRVVLLGGAAALSQQVEVDLAAAGIAEVERVAGDSRFATAGAVADRVGGTHAFVVEGANPDPGRGWPDAVSASALAGFQGAPILLVTQDQAPQPTVDALTRNGITSVTVVGGTAAVSDAVVAALEQVGIAVDRRAGPSRYATSEEVAALAESSGADGNRLWLATGANFPDALAAGPAAAFDGGVLLLVHPDTLDASAGVRDWVQGHDRLSRVTLIGGPTAISQAVEDQLRAAAS